MQSMKLVEEGEAFMKHYNTEYWAAKNLQGILDTWEK